MDFAERELSKYGWKRGDGLGKDKTGRATPVRARMKFDNHGVGYRAGEEFSDKWWERAFNRTASSIVVEVTENGEHSRIKRSASEDAVKRTKKTKRHKTIDDSFQQANDGLSDKEDNDRHKEISDEKLFTICGGLTAHKAARHGLTLSGKLARLEKQEKMATKKSEIGKDN